MPAIRAAYSPLDEPPPALLSFRRLKVPSSLDALRLICERAILDGITKPPRVVTSVQMKRVDSRPLRGFAPPLPPISH